LVEVGDRYLVEIPSLTLDVIAPDVAGRDPVDVVVEVSNPGSVTYTTPYVLETTPGQTVDQGTLSIPAGETVRLHYRPSLAATTTYTARLTGDVPATESKTVVFGEAVSLQLGAGGSSLVVPEGTALVPATITNTGSIPLTLSAEYQVVAGGSPVVTRNTAYALAPGAVVVDSLRGLARVGSDLARCGSPQSRHAHCRRGGRSRGPHADRGDPLQRRDQCGSGDG
jgi:hypothetical protein